MSSLRRELVFLILQFLDEEKFKETVHKLEQESGFFFNMRYFEDMITGGEWEEVEKYLSCFTKVEDNGQSMKIFYEIRRQKYYEALDKQDRVKAMEILVNDLRVFATFNEDIFKEIALLWTFDNVRDNEKLSKYGDTKSTRGILLAEVKKLIETNPLFHDKLQFPTLQNSRLRTLINQSLNFQHLQCKNPRPNPDLKTLFVDHSCGQPIGAGAPSPMANHFMGGVSKAAAFPPMGAHGPAPADLATSLAEWIANLFSVPHPSASAGPIGLNAPNNAAMLKRPRTSTNNPSMDYYQTADLQPVGKRGRPFGSSKKGHGQSSFSFDDLPKIVVTTLTQGSVVKSMDFHPQQQTILLVGTNVGDVVIWDVGGHERIAIRNFEVWDLSACSVPLQASLASDYTASINRVMWSPDGIVFGVAYSKHIVHIYSYQAGNDLRNHLEIEAHGGSVNDLAFSYPNNQLSLITCGEDRVIKVWDTVTGVKQFTFEGHDAPVYSIYPHTIENIPFIFSTATDGKIKVWVYDKIRSVVTYDAPGHSYTTMAYSADGTRLFSCGTNKEGESHLVEWDDREGTVKRAYRGLGKRSVGVVKFDTTKSQILVAGDDFSVKFWDMDCINPLTRIDADGGLPASACVRFNKDGNLLAVSTNDNGIKILANTKGIRMLRRIENRAFDASTRVASAAVAPTMGSVIPTATNVSTSIGDQTASVAALVLMADDLNIDSRLVDVRPQVADESVEQSSIWELKEIKEPTQCRSLRLPDNLTAATARVSRLIYTNSGCGILALASNALHKLWKWQRNDQNLTGKASASIAPQLWQPPTGILMTNDISDTNPDDAVPCFALSNNDGYVMSASGGKVSLFNMETFETMTTFMPPPPAATSLALHPHNNNTIAIGMDDSSIQIYNVQVDEVETKLNGHQKRITGLAFSKNLNVLVSSGADSQLCVWSIDGWEKQTSKFLHIPNRQSAPSLADTRIQFHADQTHLLAIHETQITIYEAPKLECLKRFFPPAASGPITHATYSCDCESIYVSFEDGSVGVLIASTLRLKCRINPNAYLPPKSSSMAHPLVIAAHPSEPNQFVLGLSDGGVHVLEPSKSEGKWETSPPIENVAGLSGASGAAGPSGASGAAGSSSASGAAGPSSASGAFWL